MDRNGCKYEHLQDEEHDFHTAPRKPQRLSKLQISGIVLILVLAVLGGAAVGSTWSFRQLWQTKPRITHCGRTSSEARARGCVLEPMVYGWMPPQCQFPEVTSQNDPFTKWQWYSDENMTQPLSLEQLERAESVDLWTNRPGYHLEHCLFLYRKLMYAMENKIAWLDKKTLNPHHATHCVSMLSTSVEAWNATTWTGLGMYSCEQTPWS